MLSPAIPSILAKRVSRVATQMLRRLSSACRYLYFSGRCKQATRDEYISVSRSKVKTFMERLSRLLIFTSLICFTFERAVVTGRANNEIKRAHTHTHCNLRIIPPRGRRGTGGGRRGKVFHGASSVNKRSEIKERAHDRLSLAAIRRIKVAEPRRYGRAAREAEGQGEGESEAKGEYRSLFLRAAREIYGALRRRRN